jgi:hypothetical protein
MRTEMDKEKKWLPKRTIDLYSRPKDQSEASKFVEQLIDQEISSGPISDGT